MSQTTQVLYFGDQSTNPVVSLQDLIAESSNSQLLGRFLTASFQVLQSNLRHLTPSERKLFRGQNFAQLLDHVRDKCIRSVVVSSVLSSTSQLGWLILHRERYPLAWSQRDHLVYGACTGALAAIAAIAAHSESDLLSLGPFIVEISMRLGIEVSRRSAALEASSDSWSAGISAIDMETIEAELQRFSDEQGVSCLKQVYVSAYSSSSITISGPPRQLQSFLLSDALRTARKVPLPIYGAFHAEHLPLPDLDWIVGSSPILDRRVEYSNSLMRPEVARDGNLRELLESSITKILREPLNLDVDFQQIRQRIQNHEISLSSIGPAHMKSLERTLRPIHVARFGSRQLNDSRNDMPIPDASDSIAIVGMAGRFPDAENVDELWRLLVEGRDVHKLVPIDRFDVTTHVDPSGKSKNTSLTPYGCFYDGVGDFDISLFKMSPREAAQTDPMQRMMLLTAYEALESSGYYDNGDDEAVRPKHGTFYGVAGDDYRQANSSQDVDTNYITGGTRAFGPGRVSYYFGWEGPSISVDTACSASAVAMHQAMASLKLRDCDTALAGGANLLTCSDMFAGLSRAKFVSKNGPCKTFDEGADGYCRADGFATLVFKRLEDAVRDKDNILGVIRAAETNHAGTAISLTHPEADTQCALFRSVLSSGGITIDDIDHIELHGTGTQAGDLAESTSVTGMLSKPRPRDRPLTISSVKPNVGHSEAASGVTSLIKGLLMLQHRTIPPHIGIKTKLNPKLPSFDDYNVVVPSSSMPYPALSRDGKRRMLVNNFNATGGITAMLLEEYKKNNETLKEDPRGDHPITLSAATSTALKSSLGRLKDHLHANPDINIAHLSYTLTARRLHHKHRFACSVRSTKDLAQKLDAELRKSPCKPTQEPFGVFVFTGQTSTMPRARVLYDTNSMFRRHIQQADRLCKDMDLPSFLEVIVSDAGSDKYRPVQLQLALVALEIALAKVFESYGIQPKAVIGHSLGEYAALCVSNSLSLVDTLWLVGKRGLLIEERCERNEYSMAVTGLSGADADELLQASPGCEIACMNGPEQTVFSGKESNIDKLIVKLQEADIRATKMSTVYGYHSRQMDAITKDLSQMVRRVSFQRPTVPFISTLLGGSLEEASLDAEYLSRQTREPVRFQQALEAVEYMLDHGQKAFWLELGPQPACLPMITTTTRAKSSEMAAGLDPKKSNWSTLSAVVTKYYALSGRVKWDEYHREYLDSLELLQLPSYPFDLKRYWIQYDGDWMIRKNQKIEQSEASMAPITLESPSLHHLEADVTEEGNRKVTFATDLSSMNSKWATRRQKLDEGVVCSTSLFVDMARSATSHLFKLDNRACPAMMVSNFTVFTGHLPKSVSRLKTSATQRSTDTNTVAILISSSASGEPIKLAQCEVVIGDGHDWTADATANAYLYQSRIDLLQLFMANGQSKRLSKHETRELCERGDLLDEVEDVLINPGAIEGVAEVKGPRTTSHQGCDPQWFEQLLQFSSIVLGATQHLQYQVEAWNTMHLLKEPEPKSLYRVHTRMHPHGESGAMIGDIHVLDKEGRATAVIKRIVLRPSLPKESLAAVATGQAYPATQLGAGQRPELRGVTDQSDVTDSDYTSTSGTRERSDSSSDASTATTYLGDSRENSPARDAVHDKFSKPRRPENPASDVQRQSNQPDDKTNGGQVASFDTIVGVLADEIGVEPDALADDVCLEDLGVDSIIQISAVARIQECMADPLPPSFLMKYNSVPKLRNFFEGTAGEC